MLYQNAFHDAYCFLYSTWAFVYKSILETILCLRVCARMHVYQFMLMIVECVYKHII
jgi:hypothetical protein